MAYRYVMNSHPRGAQEKNPIKWSCNRPWKTVTIDMYTNCMLCVCDGWLPKPVGSITDFENLEDIWSNPVAKQIQDDVGSKKFTWCAVEHCGIKHGNNSEDVYQLIFGIDDSCNLQCPSCRREKRMHTEGDDLFRQKYNAVEHTVRLLNKFQPRIHVTLACSGDPLASHIYRPLLHSYEGKSSQTFTLFTNGLLIKKQLDKTKLLDRITSFWISVDAGSKSVYETVRVGGDWDQLMANFEYLLENGFSEKVHLFYVVQKNNFRDIANFVNVLEKYNFQGNLNQLDDWGTWNRDTVVNPDPWTIRNGTYLEHNVLDPAHPLHNECKNIIKDFRNHDRLCLAPRLLQQLDMP